MLIFDMNNLHFGSNFLDSLHELVRDNLNTHEQIAKREEIDNRKKTSWQNGRSRNEYPTVANFHIVTVVHNPTTLEFGDVP